MKYKEKLKDAFNDLKHKNTFYKQIPNLLTTSRILAPFVIIPLALTGNIIGAVICASIIATTDFFDGLIARKFNITSELGRELDAVSDKFFASALIIPLIINTPIFLINLALECIIGTTNLIGKIKNKKPKTIFIGKIKTFALSISIIIGYLNLFISINSIILNSFILSTYALQTITAIKYVKKNIESDNNNFIKNKKTSKKDNNLKEKKKYKLDKDYRLSKKIDENVKSSENLTQQKLTKNDFHNMENEICNDNIKNLHEHQKVKTLTLKKRN